MPRRRELLGGIRTECRLPNHTPLHGRTEPTLPNPDFAAGKPVAAICNGAELLVEADVVLGKRMAAAPDVEEELARAGATCVDDSVVQSENLITSGHRSDVEAFDAAWLTAVSPSPGP